MTKLNGVILLLISLFITASCTKGTAVDAKILSAAFSFTIDSDGLSVQFSNESKYGNTFEWDFGDNWGASTEENPTYQYSKSGSYKVTLIAKDAEGREATAEKVVNIGTDGITPFFEVEVDGLTATFRNLSEDVTDYIWDFGDGNTSTEAAPVHQFEKRGVYNVRLTGKDPQSKTVQYEGRVDATQFPFTTLVWADEFDGEGLPDPAKWGYEKGYTRNQELQYYAAERLENTRQKDGYLHITALNDNVEIEGQTHEITSASVHTRGKAQWKYCKMEVRAKVPVSLGSWPAIWLLPNGKGWPDGGEIDLMEQVGFEPNKFHFNVHTGKYNGYNGSGSRGRSVQVEGKASDDFHTFTLEWYGDRLDFFLDGEKTYTFMNEGAYNVWPFDHEFYVILNLAFGGTWGGSAGVDKTSLPLEYVIDYIRVYQ